MADPRYTSPLAETLAEDALARFLRYVVIDTQAAYGTDTYPSRLEQLVLSRMLEGELRDLGLDEVVLTAHGYVIATLPGTVDTAPTIALIAHVDTSPEAPGSGVIPIVHRSWDGAPIVLPGDPSQILDPAENDALRERVGQDLVTSDGTTLLGADDKAGVAEIMAAVAYLVTDEAPRASARIVFTVDEEVGTGTQHLDLAQIGAHCGYTLDGSGLGELEIETFSAYELTLTVTGVPTHPGTAKGKLVNAIKVVADIVAALPRDTLSPETTEDREGFVHPSRVSGSATEATLWWIARDHDDVKLGEHVEVVRSIASRIVAAEPRASFTLDVTEQYRNMRNVLDRHPDVVTAAEEAIRRVGVEPIPSLIRGGTDGARLSEMGLPTPNIFTGGQEYHSVREWATVQDMGAAAATVVELLHVWGERAAGDGRDGA